MRRVIPDTSCLILLKKIGALELLSQLYDEILISEIVLEEFKESLPDSFKVVPFKDRVFFSILCQQLDPGEASVISLAGETSDFLMVLDDLKGRKIAAALDLNFTGTLGLIIKAKRIGLITKIEPYVEKLIAAGIRISPQVLTEIKKNYP